MNAVAQPTTMSHIPRNALLGILMNHVRYAIDAIEMNKTHFKCTSATILFLISFKQLFDLNNQDSATVYFDLFLP